MIRIALLLLFTYVSCAFSGCCVGTPKHPGCLDVRIEGLGGDSIQRDVPIGVDGVRGQSPQSRGGFLRGILWMNI
jgi:hypothetical protein